MNIFITIEDAKVLIPNKSHNNFTQSSEIIEKGKIVRGNAININGKRKGEDFTYRLFKTDTDKLIHLNKVKPMNVREVVLGNDGTAKQQPISGAKPTVIKMPYNDVLFTKKTITGAIVGAGVGFFYAQYKKADSKKRNMFIGIGAVVGFAVSRYMERKSIIVKPS